MTGTRLVGKRSLTRGNALSGTTMLPVFTSNAESRLPDVFQGVCSSYRSPRLRVRLLVIL